MTQAAPQPIHATCIAIDGRAVLIEGPSGSGKSDLALRLIDRGALLVSDDQTLLRTRGDRLFAVAPERISGKIEVRGLGILDCESRDETPVSLLITIGTPDRLPDPLPAERSLCGTAVPALTLAALEPSAPIKVELALSRFGLPLVREPS